ncbi:hypothetical protein A2U01_0102655 [Trifolium medium]|uniref:Uncharacterized protein n=1 Tax=Trifolium medium TaxID=97028 RepID=A0A392V1U5_9FABA|nr:hypothetical protein [Trifolium medium]
MVGERGEDRERRRPPWVGCHTVASLPETYRHGGPATGIWTVRWLAAGNHDHQLVFLLFMRNT